MPNIKSAKKRVKLANKNTLRNKVVKTNLKTVLKKFNDAIAKSAENKDEIFKLAVKKIDQAAAKGVIHKNNAARKKSNLALKYNATK